MTRKYILLWIVSCNNKNKQQFLQLIYVLLRSKIVQELLTSCYNIKFQVQNIPVRTAEKCKRYNAISITCKWLVKLSKQYQYFFLKPLICCTDSWHWMNLIPTSFFFPLWLLFLLLYSTSADFSYCFRIIRSIRTIRNIMHFFCGNLPASDKLELSSLRQK